MKCTLQKTKKNTKWPKIKQIPPSRIFLRYFFSIQNYMRQLPFFVSKSSYPPCPLSMSTSMSGVHVIDAWCSCSCLVSMLMSMSMSIFSMFSFMTRCLWACQYGCPCHCACFYVHVNFHVYLHEVDVMVTMHVYVYVQMMYINRQKHITRAIDDGFPSETEFVLLLRHLNKYKNQVISW